MDLKRQLRAERLFSEKDSDILIHAADVANENDRAISVELQYPAAKERERYAAVKSSLYVMLKGVLDTEPSSRKTKTINMFSGPLMSL